jgi:hypothetical protein
MVSVWCLTNIAESSSPTHMESNGETARGVLKRYLLSLGINNVNEAQLVEAPGSYNDGRAMYFTDIGTFVAIAEKDEAKEDFICEMGTCLSAETPGACDSCSYHKPVRR